MSEWRPWIKLGRVLAPGSSRDWLARWAGASCAVPLDASRFRVYITGRDVAGRSRIGTAILSPGDAKLSEISDTPIIPLGERGTFDENGTSYPHAVWFRGRLHLYYLGWIRGVHVPWYNGLGLAVSDDGLDFRKVSKAPVFERDEDDYLGVGSAFVAEEGGRLKMWYSRFERWGQHEGDQKHYYNIKYAESPDGLAWQRDKAICIDFGDAGTEYAIAKPSVLKLAGKYCMWYSHRGAAYRIGFAVSDDGRRWRRRDELVGIGCSPEGWDSEMICYAHVFEAGDQLYMLYNGNDYGAGGLGLAATSKAQFAEMIVSL